MPHYVILVDVAQSFVCRYLTSLPEHYFPETSRARFRDEAGDDFVPVIHDHKLCKPLGLCSVVVPYTTLSQVLNTFIPAAHA